MKVNRNYKRFFLGDLLLIIGILLIFVLIPLNYTTTLQKSFSNALFIIAFGILVTYLKTKFFLDCVLVNSHFKVTYYNNIGMEMNIKFPKDSKFVIIRRDSFFGKKTLIRVFHKEGVKTFEVLDDGLLSKLPESEVNNVMH